MPVRRCFCTEEYYRPGKHADGRAIPFQWLVRPSENIKCIYHWNLSDIEFGKKKWWGNGHELRTISYRVVTKKRKETWVLNSQFSYLSFSIWPLLTFHTSLPFWCIFFLSLFFFFTRSKKLFKQKEKLVSQGTQLHF